MVRYCDKCGAAITSGGHKSAVVSGGLFGNAPYLCDDCYASESESVAAAGKVAVKGAGCFAKVFIGVLAGLGMTAGICTLLSKTTVLNGLSPSTVLVAIEVLAIACFVAGKIGSRILKSRFLRFICCVIAYFAFWMALVFGIGMYFILKYCV